MYIIETRNKRNPNWAMRGIGDNNLFTTDADARSMVEELKTLGDDWDTAEYRVVSLDNICDSCLEAAYEEGGMAQAKCHSPAVCGCGVCKCDECAGTSPHVCDSCLQAAYDELRIPTHHPDFWESERHTIMRELGGELADHLCEQIESDGGVSCGCGCRGD